MAFARESLSRAGEKVVFKRTSLAINADPVTQEFEQNVPASSYINNFDPAPMQNFSQMPKTGFVIAPELEPEPLVRFSVKKEKMASASVFSKEINFDVYELSYLANEGGVIASASQRIEKGGKLVGTQVPGYVIWQHTPRNQWENALIYTSETKSTSSITVNLPGNYLPSNNSFMFQGGDLPAYDHFAAYFSVRKILSEGDQKKFLLKENKSFSIRGKAKPEDLASNETIQTKLPQIQKIANEIRKKVKSDRAKQVKEILSYLSKNYSFDSDAMIANEIRPLTTEQALKAKRGVPALLRPFHLDCARPRNSYPNRVWL